MILDYLMVLQQESFHSYRSAFVLFYVYCRSSLAALYLQRDHNLLLQYRRKNNHTIS